MWRRTPFGPLPPLLGFSLGALTFHLQGRLWPPAVLWALALAGAGLLLLGSGLGAALAKVRWPAAGTVPSHVVGLPAWERRLHTGFLAAVLFGLCWAGLQAARGVDSRLDPALEGRPLRLHGWVSAMPSRFEQGWRYRFWVQACEDPDCPVGQTLRLNAYAQQGRSAGPPAPLAALPVGRPICLSARLKRPLAPLNPDAFDAELRALEEGVVAIGSLRATVPCPQTAWPLQASAWEQVPARLLTGIEWLRTRLRDRLVRSLSTPSLRAADRLAKRQGRAGEEAREEQEPVFERLRPVAAATLVALVVGEQNAIPGRWWTIFNLTGVGHLMSISGLHITLFAGLMLAALKALCQVRIVARALHRLRLSPVRLRWSLAVAAALGYSLIAGWGIPAQRTCWMLTAAAWSLNSGRSKRLSRVLALAAFMVTLLDPWAPMAPGFWLSFAAVAALVWFGGREQLQRGAAWREAVRAQVAATLALAPMGALFFGAFSVVGPLANAWAIPFVSALLTPYVLGCALLCLVLPTLASWLLLPALWATAWMLHVLEWMSTWPMAAWPLARPSGVTLVLASLACVALLAPMPLRGRPLFALGIVPLLSTPGEHPRPGELWLSAFDVGQGMAVLIESDGRRLLYDAGPSHGSDSEAATRIILPYLRSRGIDHVDALVVSHLDKDHSGGALEVTRKLHPDWIASSVERPFLEREHLPCREGQQWQWGQGAYRFLHPPEVNTTAVRSSTNARSCVLVLQHPLVSLMLPGDLEKAQEKRLLETYGSGSLRADVLLAPHHGSASSSSAAFLDAVAPRWAIFQVGYRNRFRHPNDQVLLRYQARSVEVLRSDHHGFIQMRFAPGRDPQVIRWRLRDPPYWRLPGRPQAGGDPSAGLTGKG